MFSTPSYVLGCLCACVFGNVGERCLLYKLRGWAGPRVDSVSPHLFKCEATFKPPKSCGSDDLDSRPAANGRAFELQRPPAVAADILESTLRTFSNSVCL